MRNTKEQQAQAYAEKQLSDICLMLDYEENKQIGYFHTYDIQKAYLDGYTACEQSLWHSVEDVRPEEDGAYLTLTTDKEIEIFVWEDGEWLVSGYTVAYWRELPSLPDTNTEKNG